MCIQRLRKKCVTFKLKWVYDKNNLKKIRYFEKYYLSLCIEIKLFDMSMTKRWLESIGAFETEDFEDFVDDYEYQYQQWQEQQRREEVDSEEVDSDPDDE